MAKDINQPSILERKKFDPKTIKTYKVTSLYI